MQHYSVNQSKKPEKGRKITKNKLKGLKKIVNPIS